MGFRKVWGASEDLALLWGYLETSVCAASAPTEACLPWTDSRESGHMDGGRGWPHPDWGRELKRGLAYVKPTKS